MLFWIFVIVAVIFGLIALLAWDEDSEFWFASTATVSFISAVVAIIMLLAIIFNHCGLDPYIAENQAKYEALVYQYENDFYDNDNDLGKYELVKEIQDWNEDLAYYKAAQNDLWIGVFHADIYDQFEFIALEKE